MLEKRVNQTTIRLIRDDLTDLAVEAFVFYADPSLKLGAGFGTAIAGRGGPKIATELEKLSPLKVGEATVTGAGNMKAKYIIHAVGPRFQEPDIEAKLGAALRAALRRAEEKGVAQLGLPPMGVGFYGVPIDVSARVMTATLRQHLTGTTALKEVVICVRDHREVKPFEEALKTLA